MKKYKEIFRLKEMLEKENIPFIFRNIFDGFQICYPAKKNRVCSVIEHEGSYGHNQDLLEIMGLLTDGETDDDVLGYLNAENVFERIRKHYKGGAEMSFSEQTEKLTQDLIQVEYKNACEKFGEKFNSLHEGYAFLLKEMEEVEMYIKRLKNDIDSMWSYIKSKENKTKFIKYYVDNCFDEFTNNSIKGLAQVGAVLMKIKNTLPEETTEKRKVCSKDCEYINRAYGSYFCNGQKNAPDVNLGDDCYYNDKTEEPKF